MNNANSGEHKIACSEGYAATIHKIAAATSVCVATCPTEVFQLKLMMLPNVRWPCNSTPKDGIGCDGVLSAAPNQATGFKR